MNSSRPYLIRALYDWILDNACTPHILVNAEFAGVDVPRAYVKDGRIVLNISPSAVHALQLENEALWFTGRFAGTSTPVHVPMEAVLGIYARENGQGMFFEATGKTPDPKPGPPSDGSGRTGPSGSGKPVGSGPRLRVVK